MPVTHPLENANTVRAVLEAEDIAVRSGQRLNSVHLLLAFFTFQNRAQILLGESGLHEDSLLQNFEVLGDEPARMVERIRQRARELARGAASKEIDCLHLLIALTRFRACFAYEVLTRSGVALASLRNVAVSYVTGNMPRRYQAIPREPWSPAVVQVQTQVQARAREEVDEFSSLPQAQLAAEPTPRERAPDPRPRKSGTRLEDIAPTLARIGTDLTALARAGELDPVVGRERELERLIDILGKRRSNNPILIGPPGVGKTAIVEGLAVCIAEGQDLGRQDPVLVSLDTGSLLAGTGLRGAFSEKMLAIKTEVGAAKGRIIVFIDELHTLIGAGQSGDSAQDAANELKAALARGEFPCVGATTLDEFKRHVEKDAALERRFDPIYVEEPSCDDAILIMEGAVEPYRKHHGVDYSLDALHAAVNLSHRFVPDRRLPDKAFAVIDLAGSRARRRGSERVERLDVAQIVHEWSGVPLERLADADAERLNQAETILGEHLVGHRHVVAAVSRTLRRGFAGFNRRRPIGSFLFLGPSGVGKTELVKVIAEFLFGNRDRVVRLDMSELSEQHSVARLIGAQPGYVGYERGGQLTEALRRRPFQVVLFDEIEKAHPDVLNILLQILDEGTLTDSAGQKVSFTSTVVVLTSNLGAGEWKSGGGVGFAKSDGQGQARRVLDAAKAALPPELWGRIEEPLVFSPLARDELQRIADLQLQDSSRSLFGEREITLRWDETVTAFLLGHGGYSPAAGARGMRQCIQEYIEAPVAESVLRGELCAGDVAVLSIIDGAVRVCGLDSIAAASL
jgi:ATP-dependent Clp protease ATP-binding subunit ClpC